LVEGNAVLGGTVRSRTVVSLELFFMTRSLGEVS
jgi:hypothetical protein